MDWGSQFEEMGPRFIGRRRQLFLDDWLIEHLENIERIYEEPVKHTENPVLNAYFGEKGHLFRFQSGHPSERSDAGWFRMG